MQLNYERVADVALELRRSRQDPLCAYLYDLDALRVHVSRLVDSLPPQCELFYAVKANAEPPILQALADQVHGFEVASGGELRWVREHCAGMPLIFGGPGKLESELREAVDLGVELIHVESRLELQRLKRIAEQAGCPVDILLRVNLALDDLPSTSLTMGGRPTPFGLDESELADTLSWLSEQNQSEQSQVRLHGFHFHLLSHQLNAASHLQLLGGYFRKVKAWCDQFRLGCRHLNVGGGIGINYLDPTSQFDWTGFSAGLHALIETERMQAWTIRFEFGRYVTAACGYYVMEVLDLKLSHGQWFAVARGGTHQFRTPAAQNHSHPFRVISNGLQPPDSVPPLKDERVTVVGQLCTPKDVLARDVLVERMAVGDFLIFPYAGAYAWNISHQNFLRHPKPVCCYLDRAQVVVP